MVTDPERTTRLPQTRHRAYRWVPTLHHRARHAPRRGHADAVTSVTFSADGRYALSGSADRTLKLWVLDWELADAALTDWDEGARPYLEMFLSRHTPYAIAPERVRSPLSRLFKSAPAEDEISRTLTRQGPPVWTESDFQALLHTLGQAGYGWLRAPGIRRHAARRRVIQPDAGQLPAGGRRRAALATAL